MLRRKAPHCHLPSGVAHKAVVYGTKVPDNERLLRCHKVPRIPHGSLTTLLVVGVVPESAEDARWCLQMSEGVDGGKGVPRIAKGS